MTPRKDGDAWACLDDTSEIGTIRLWDSSILSGPANLLLKVLKMKLYICGPVNSNGDKDEGTYYLVSEYGEVLSANHYKNRNRAKYFLFDRKIQEGTLLKEELKEFEFIFLGEDEMTAEEIRDRIHNQSTVKDYDSESLPTEWFR